MRREPSSSSRDAGTALALFGLLIVGAGLLALVALVLPQALGVLAVVGLFVVLGTVQYATWGVWLSRNRPSDDGSDQASSDRAPNLDDGDVRVD